MEENNGPIIQRPDRQSPCFSTPIPRWLPGQALHEYAVALALIALLALGALHLLGWNISGLFVRAGSANTGEARQLMSLVGADKVAASGGTQGSTRVSLYIDPKTGQLLIQDGGSGGKNATSIDGGVLIDAASSELNRLSEQAYFNGTPVPSDIRKLIQQMAAIGEQLGAGYKDYMMRRPTIDQLNQEITARQQEGIYGDPPYPQDFINQVAQYAENTIQFYSLYQQIQGMIAQNPGLSGLQTQVSDLAGAISSVSYNNVGKPFLGQAHTESILQPALAEALQNTPMTAQYFQQLESASEGMPPAQREAYYQQTMVTLAEQYQAGTIVTDQSGLSLSLNLLGVSANATVDGSSGVSVAAGTN